MTTDVMERIEDRAAGTAPGPAAPAGSAETYGVSCPSCGGALRAHEGERSILCGYCGTALLIAQPRGVQSFIMGPRVTEGKARLAAIHHIGEATFGRVKASHAAIVDLHLVHVPFWRMHGRLMGWISGDRVETRRREPTGDGELARDETTLAEERVPVSRLVFKRVDWSTPACTLPVLGLEGISLRAGFLEWDVYEPGSKRDEAVALPLRSLRQAKRDAFTYLTRVTVPTGARVRASRYHLFDSSFSLYYYPVFIIRYRHRKRLYTVTVDGGSGAVVRGETPAVALRDWKGIIVVPAVLAALARLALPLVGVAAVALYVYDTAEARSFIAPHRWLMMRLREWYGGTE